MSRIAYIISAYKDAPHLSRLIKALDEDADFYVHIDRKADSRPFKELLPEGKVTFVQSHWVSWGGWEQVEYQKELLAAVLHSGIEYTRIVCLSAQYVYEKLCTEKELVRYFKTSFVPSELCIQTLVFNSPFAARALSVEGGYTGLSALTPLHYIIYGKSIKVLTLEDWSALQQSGKMFCRKVVSGASDSLVKTIETERKQEIS